MIKKRSTYICIYQKYIRLLLKNYQDDNSLLKGLQKIDNAKLVNLEMYDESTKWYNLKISDESPKWYPNYMFDNYESFFLNKLLNQPENWSLIYIRKN